MQPLLYVALATLAACSSNPSPTPAPSSGSAAPDPWSGATAGSAAGSGSAEAVPKWASDPPTVLRDKINGVNAHVVVLKSTPTFPEYREALTIVEKTPGVVAAEPFIFVELQISSATRSQVSLALKAVDPKRVERVLALPSTMKVGKVASLAGEPPSIILGDDLAKTVGVTIGDDVTLTPSSDGTSRPKVFRVTGTFHVGFDEYDERLGYASISAVQAMLGRGDDVMGIELAVDDLDKSDAIAKTIEKALGGPPYSVMDWYELNKQLFTALYDQRRP